MLDAYMQKINLPLLRDIIIFVAETAKIHYMQRQKLYRDCIFLGHDKNQDDFQQKYGFLYLGELLERYEERFGMSDPDRRAIALALGYVNHLTTSEMFVGNQKNLFVQELRRRAEDDLYLTGAMCLLCAGQSEEQL